MAETVNSIPPKWARREAYGWVAWLAGVIASGAWLESRGMHSRDDEYPTFTAVISRYVPAWLWFLLLGALKGWLDNHFSQSYESWAEPEHYDYPR